MNNKFNLKNKKTLVIIVIALFLILAISISTVLYKGRNINKLQGDASSFRSNLEQAKKEAREDAKKAGEEITDSLNKLADALRAESSSSVDSIKTAKDICTNNQTEGILIVRGTIIENTGEEGPAKITLSSGDSVYTENININSESVTRFTYSLPQGVYNLKIEKDGFITYEDVITSDDQLKIILKNKENPHLYESNYLYGNLYYIYTDTGELTLYSQGDFDPTLLDESNIFVTSGDTSKLTILGNIVERQLAKNGVVINITGNAADIYRIIINIEYAATIGTGTSFDGGKTTLRETMKLYKTQIETGVCNDENYEDSTCSGKAGSLIATYGSAANALAVVDILLDIPVISNTTIANDISFIGPYLLGFVKADTLTIPESSVRVFADAIVGSEINTLNYNSNQNIPHDFASLSRITNVNINSEITEIDNNAFSGDEEIPGNITTLNLPNTITRIGNNAFEDSGLVAVTLPTSLTQINQYAFEGNNLEYVTIPASVTSIESNAFAGNKLKSVSFVNTSDNKSKLTKIGDSAFNCSNYDTTKCNSIATMTLPASLERIEYDAFKNNKLESIIIPESVVSISNDAFYGNPFTNIAIQGNATRFNDSWSSIGFPAELKPTK